jgi:aryl-alcohol dehydrogenase-like predicted oxidoreductase
MKYRLLGNSGLRVSEAGLGIMTFGEEWGWVLPRTKHARCTTSFARPGHFIDTANFFTNGSSESFLGEFMKDFQSFFRLRIYGVLPDWGRVTCDNTKQVSFKRHAVHGVQ